MAQAVVLDLFAGTGAFGFEALSRGAAAVTLVDIDSHNVAGLAQVKSSLDAGQATIKQADAEKWLTSSTPTPFDIVFLDPPFKADLLSSVCHLLENNHWLAPHAWVYVEQAKTANPPCLPKNWHIHRDKTAGQVRYYLVERVAIGQGERQ